MTDAIGSRKNKITIKINSKGLIEIGKTSFVFFLLIGFAYFLVHYIMPTFAAVLPGSGPFKNSTGDGIPFSANLTRGDFFFADGDNIFIVVNYTCTATSVCNRSMGITANFSSVGVGNRTGVFKENGTAPGQTWAVYELNATANITNITGLGKTLLVQPSTIQIYATDGNLTANYTNLFNATVVLFNMSTIPGCPPEGENIQLPPAMILLNGTLASPINKCTTTCAGDDIAEQNSTGDWNMCGPAFGGDTTNFTKVASTGNFSNFPFVIDIPGKAKINFSTNVSMDTQAKAQALFEFAMKNIMSGGRIGVNETEWNGTSKPNLNLSARLTIYNISGRFGISPPAMPIISRRATYGSGSFGECGSACSGIIWDGQNFTFTVSSFSEYDIVRGLSVVLSSPANVTHVNTRNVNFTYTPKWNATTNVKNTTLFLNISGTWANPGTNATNQTVLVNATVNGINYTFSQDEHFLWNIVMYDTTGSSDTNAYNWSVIVDTVKPTVNIISPTKGTFNDNHVTLKFSASDTYSLTCTYQIDGGSAIGANPDKDIAISGLANGEKTIKVSCKDPAGNEGTASVTFSISASTTETQITTPIVSVPSEETSKVFIPKLVANKATIVSIEKGDVTKISIIVNTPVNSIYIDVNRLDAKPTEVSAALGVVYRYLDIKSSGLTENIIDKVTIAFKVEKSWITSNSADASKIYLNRFANGVWNRLNTTKVLEDTTTITYEAVTPGFSTFAIAFEEAAPSITPTPAPAPVPTPAPIPTPTPLISGVETGGTSPIIMVVVVILIITIIAVVFLRQKLFNF